MKYCLPNFAADAFKKALKSGEINPEELSTMSSKDRRALLAKHVGEENAVETNTLFEKKLYAAENREESLLARNAKKGLTGMSEAQKTQLLDLQQKGLIDWIKTSSGMKPEVQKDLLKQVEGIRKAMSPAEEAKFHEDLIAQKLGTKVTLEETTKVAELADAAQTARETLATDPTNKELQIAYGNKFLDMHDYTESLKPTKNTIVGVINIPRTLTTVGDWGWTFRQGWGMMSRPQLWEGLAKSFGYAFKEDSYRKLQASIIGDPDYQLLKGKLRLPAVSDKLSGKEEEFMNQFTGKLPVFKQVERGQQGLATYVRWSVAKKMLRDARLAGEDIRKGSKPVTDIANSVNNFSGSGNLGTGDKYANIAPILNASFFSARKASATINMMDPRNYLDPRISLTVRKANFRNLIGSVGMTASAIYLAKLAGADVDLNPTSSNFLTVSFGKRHIDFTGGNKAYGILVARMIENKTTSASGKTTELGKGYKPQTRGTVLGSFARNKLSPLASTVVDWFLGPIPTHDSGTAKALFGPLKNNAKFDIKREAVGDSVPMMIDLVIQSIQEDPTGLLYNSLLDYFGNSVQVY